MPDRFTYLTNILGLRLYKPTLEAFFTEEFISILREKFYHFWEDF
jgi:hypothetical protein